MDEEIIDAAMCLWEATLNQRGEPKVDAAFEANGAVAVRYFIGGLAERCEADYQKARAEGYDDCFDWEFVPDWLASNVDWENLSGIS